MRSALEQLPIAVADDQSNLFDTQAGLEQAWDGIRVDINSLRSDGVPYFPDRSCDFSVDNGTLRSVVKRSGDADM